jgi:MFS transporter, SP family, sugar:H+ symporter
MKHLSNHRFVEDFGYFDPGLHSYNISAKNQTLLYGTMLSFACVAAAISGPLGARFGRRFGLGLCAITSIIGPAIQTGATSWSVVIVGRCFTGLGMGFAANFVIPYWTETTPATLRGLVVVMYQGIINVAGFIGACINQGTHSLDTRWAYRAPLLVQLAPPIILLPFLFWIPDTPRMFKASMNTTYPS